jgi:hypothetical protein
MVYKEEWQRALAHLRIAMKGLTKTVSCAETEEAARFAQEALDDIKAAGGPNL